MDFCSLSNSDLIKSIKIQLLEPSPLTLTVFYAIHWLTLAEKLDAYMKSNYLYSYCYAFQCSFKMLMNKRIPTFPTGDFCWFPVSHLIGLSNHKVKILFRIKNILSVPEFQLIQSMIQ